MTSEMERLGYEHGRRIGRLIQLIALASFFAGAAIGWAGHMFLMASGTNCIDRGVSDPERCPCAYCRLRSALPPEGE